MIDYKSFLKKDCGTLPQCAEAMNTWMAEHSVQPLSVETLWDANGGAEGRAVTLEERGLRLWFNR